MGQDLKSIKSIKTNQALLHPPLNIACHSNVIINQEFAKLIEYSLAIPSRQNCKKWEQQVKSYYYNVDTSLLYLPTRYHYKSTQLCGGAGIMNIYYQYYPLTLQSQIMNRIHTHQLFSQQQIWGLLYVLCAAASQLHIKDKKLGKIALEHVLINPQNAQIKIATGLSFYSDTAIDQILAPQSIIFSRGVINKNSSKLQQAYCIGIVVLCAMLLIPSAQVNQIVKKPHQKLNQLVEQLRNSQFYPIQLKQIAIKMINFDPIQRITPITIVEHLQPYQQLIIHGSKPPTQAVTQILKQDHQHNNRPSKLIRVTLGTPLRQFSYQQQQKQQTYSKKLKNSIEKTQSQYVSTKKQKITPKQKADLDQFLDMVDRHLQNSRNSYRS